MTYVNSLFIYMFQNLSNGILGAQFGPYLLCYIFVLKIQDPPWNYNSQSASHLNVFESQNNFHLLPFSCVNFDYEPKIRVATPKMN